MLFGVIVILVLIAAIDLPRLIRAKKKRELIVYTVFFFAVSAYLIIFALDIRPTSSFEALHLFFENKLNLSYSKFK